MTMLLWTVLIVSEIGLAIYELAGKATKKEWTLKRLTVSGGQIVIYLLMVALPGIDFSFRFTGLFILLGIRALIAGIFWLIDRHNENKKKNLWIVLSAVLGIVLISMSMIPAFVFKDYKGRPVTGSYEVASCSAILIDETRLETYENDGSYREVPVYFYYPSSIEDINECSLPLVIFSHGAFGYYESNTSTYMELASNGYVVVSMEHPYHSLFTKDTAGKIITVDPEFFNTAINVGNNGEAEVYEITSKWMELREADMNFALDTIIKASKDSEDDDAWFYVDDNKEKIAEILKCADPERIGLMGHSLGGATAVTVGRREDVSAVIDFDGTMLGENTGMKDGEILVNEEPYD
nr:dienelactone hydrolase family protein [Lachnospiraceae bacterium]